MTIPNLGEVIPDGSIGDFPDGSYAAALLADDGSRRIVQGGYPYVGPTAGPTSPYHMSNFYGWMFWNDNDELQQLNFQNNVRYMPHTEQAHLWTSPYYMPTESVNPAPDFFTYREHLCVLAHDLPLEHRFDRLALRDTTTRRFPGQPALTSTEDQVRNGNVTQHTREMLGWLWQEIHVLAGMSHLDDWQTFRDWLKPIIEGYCACFDARGSLGRIHIGHDYRLWESALRMGKRFIPDFSVKPFGIIEIPDVYPVTDAISVIDLQNFDNAVDWFSVSDPDETRDVWPDGIDSVSSLLVEPTEVPVPNPADAAQQSLVDYWQQQWIHLITYADYSLPAGIRSYRSYVELQLLAVLRNSNWSNITNIRKMNTAKWDAFDYALIPEADHPIIPVWADRDDFWFNGYQYFDGTMLVRDALPQDPSDPYTFPFNAAMNQSDPRVSTYVVVVDRDEVDRTASGIPSAQPWNLNLDANGNPTGDTTGTPASDYWQGRIDAILGVYQ